MNEIEALARVWLFKNCTSESIWAMFPDKEAAMRYLPDEACATKIGKTYLLT